MMGLTSLQDILIVQKMNSCVRYSSKEYVPKKTTTLYIEFGIMVIIKVQRMINAGILIVSANI